MSQTQLSAEEIARRGEELYQTKLRNQVETANQGKFLVLDIDSGDFEMDVDDLAASERLLARKPNGRLYGLRVGYPAAYRIGGRFHVEAP